MTHVLPDLLRPGLRLIVCGTDAGTKSARVGYYYAGPGNKFWKTLHSIGLTPRQIQPSEYAQLVDLWIGLTDISKTTAGSDTVIRKADFDRARLHQLVFELQPRVLAFNGKRAAKAFLEREVVYGRQPDLIGKQDASLQSKKKTRLIHVRRLGLNTLHGTPKALISWA